MSIKKQEESSADKVLYTRGQRRPYMRDDCNLRAVVSPNKREEKHDVNVCCSCIKQTLITLL